MIVQRKVCGCLAGGSYRGDAQVFEELAIDDITKTRSLRPTSASSRTFAIGGDQHVQYFNRHFGYVLRPARVQSRHDPYVPGLHHFCFRVESVADVVAIAKQLRGAGIEASEAKLYAQYAPDYWATFFKDPDGVRLEVTNYRQERRDRHDHWNQFQG